MTKRFLPMLLALLLALGTLSGCAQSTELRSYSEDAILADPGQHALSAYAPDTVVMTIDGSEVYWNEFAYWLCTTAKTFAEEANVPAITDWSAVYDEETGETYAEALLRVVTEQEKQYHSLEARAETFGLKPGEDCEAYMEQSLAESLEGFQISEDDDKDALLKKYYLDADVLRYQAKISYLYLMLYQEMFGADGEKLSDAEVNDYAAQNGYLTAKHILLGTVDANGQPLPEEQKAKKLESAQRIIERLSQIEDPAELVKEFDRYAGEYNEDPGVASYPNGYCFTSGQMDPAFEAGAAALQPYQVSPAPVETAYGYHVILRVPTTGADVLDYNADGTPYLLRSDAAQAIYTQMIHAWIDDAEVKWSKDFENLDVQKLFTVEKEETVWEKIDFLHWFH